jgi:hypothetical protein
VKPGNRTIVTVLIPAEGIFWKMRVVVFAISLSIRKEFFLVEEEHA